MTWLHPHAENVLTHLRSLDEPAPAWEIARDTGHTVGVVAASLRDLRRVQLATFEIVAHATMYGRGRVWRFP